MPVEISYDAVNQQLEQALANLKIELPEEAAWVKVTSCKIESYGDGILLTAAFRGRKSWLRSASGTMYLVGVPVFTEEDATLQVDQLEFSADTNSLLLELAQWLAAPVILETLKESSVIEMSDEVASAKEKANQELETLRKEIADRVNAKVAVDTLKVERLMFLQDGVYGVVRAKGSLSAQFQ